MEKTEKEQGEEFKKQDGEESAHVIAGDGNKLKKANKKIAEMLAEDEKEAEKKQAEIDAKKKTIGPNPALALEEKASKEFDEQKALAAKVEAEKEALLRAAHAAQQATHYSGDAQKGLHGSDWVAAMPGYIQESVPFVKFNPKDADAGKP